MLFELDREGEELSAERWTSCEDISALTRAVLLLLTMISYGPAMRETSLNVSQLRNVSLLLFAPSISLRLVKGGVTVVLRLKHPILLGLFV